ncbi:MAG TPA: DsrE family protein [Candidatus Acidoferrum sp.]|nr:DsrE family protein [Candidatus Acidoferrum sp.]
MNTLTIIIQDAPYGSKKAYNAFRYASALLANQVTVSLFLLADGVGVAKRGQKTPTGYYNTANVLGELIAKGVRVRTCGTYCAASALANKNSSEVLRWGA